MSNNIQVNSHDPITSKEASIQEDDNYFLATLCSLFMNAFGKGMNLLSPYYVSLTSLITCTSQCLMKKRVVGQINHHD